MCVDGVEIDPEVVSVGRRYFGMGEIASLTVHVDAARSFLEAARGPYDLII